MAVAAPPTLADRLEPLLGAPVQLDSLKHKPGRRRTLRATGTRASAIVKLYASARAPQVAARIAALARGPAEPLVPEVLLLDEGMHMLVLSELPGAPLRERLLDDVPGAAERAGAALGAWHRAWHGDGPTALTPHTLEREREILLGQAARAPAPIAARVRAELPRLLEVSPLWECRTAVHRDLYEEQILLGDAVGLIDLDDAALGPPELDLGNLWAHLDLLAFRRGRDLDGAWARLTAAYAESGPPVSADLLQACRRLTLLRLACIHRLPELADVTVAGPAAAARRCPR